MGHNIAEAGKWMASSCRSGRVSAYLNFFRGWGLLLPVQPQAQTPGLKTLNSKLFWKPSFVMEGIKVSTFWESEPRLLFKQLYGFVRLARV